ncbi:MAG: hypothetical protein V4510_05925 [bacterium]
MLRLAAVAIVLLFAMPVTGRAADAPAAPPGALRVLSDNAGDHVMHAAGQPTPVSRWDAADLLSLDVSEQAKTFTVVLGVKALADSTEPIVDNAYYTVDFTARGSFYRIHAAYNADSGTSYGYLQQKDPTYGYYTGSEGLPAIASPTNNTITFLVDRHLLVGVDGAPLLRGDTLSEFAGTGRTTGDDFANAFSGGTVSGLDLMPDNGVGTTPWVVLFGGSETGTVLAKIADPVRISNGEATTFLYEVKVRNKADHPDTIEVRTNSTPPNWTLTFPQKEVRLGDGEETTVPVLVTVPFQHIHGAYYSVNVTFQSRSDPLSHANIELGVRYTKVPQPAGHHNKVYWHTGSGAPFINTLETAEVPPDEKTSPPSSYTCGFSGGSASGEGQMVPLVPDLGIGVDVDMKGNGTAIVNLMSSTPSPGLYSVGGYFVVWYGDEAPSSCVYEAPKEAIAAMQRSAPLQMQANTPLQVTLPVRPLAYGDRLEYRPGIHMALIIAFYEEVSPPFFGNGLLSPPTVADGTLFQLPLAEYHDKVNQYFAALSGVDLYATGGQQQLVNPGKTALFEVTAEMAGKDGADFNVELAGTNVEWAHIVGDTTLHLSAGDKHVIAVAVTAPADAKVGSVADLTLNAVKSDDANVRSLIRLLATVDNAAVVPDQATRVSDLEGSANAKHTPDGGWLVAVALAGAVVLVRRRKDDQA